MKHSAHLRQCLEMLDVAAVRKLWTELPPFLPLLDSDEVVLKTMHVARTASEAMRFSYRAYSHAWLTERGLPSLLPDELKPKAERMYPRIVEGVGIAVKVPPERREL